MKTIYWINSILAILIIVIFANFEDIKNQKLIKRGFLLDNLYQTHQLPEIEPVSDKNTPAPFYVINISATANKDEAVKAVKELKAKYGSAGYLWIPDYESLSGKKIFSVFLGPFEYMEDCMKKLGNYRKIMPEAYGICVQHKKERITLHDKFDIRINNKKTFIILIYEIPTTEDEIISEDWGWFVNKVGWYFGNYYPDKVIINYVYGGWLDDVEIQELNSEVGNPDIYGYIFINNNEKIFHHHDLPNGVVFSACSFFNLQINEDWEEKFLQEGN